MALPAGGAAALAIDSGALASLKRAARDDPKAALSAAASQFEALFVQMLLKSMREALPQDGPLSSDSGRMYTSMFDQQVAQHIGARGIGLRQMLERQLAPALAAASDARQPAAGDATTKAAAAAGSVTPPRTPPGPTAARDTRIQVHVASSQLWGRVRGAVAPATAAPPIDKSADAAEAGAAAGLPANVRGFIDRMRPYAEAAARTMGVPAHLLLAQAGLETGWGRAQPRTGQGGASHNLFGIKAGPGWTGAVAAASTTEYVAGALVRTVERFRSYGSYTEAFQDFARLITGNARYADALKGQADPAAYARGLQKGGYATDPQYADKLLRAIRMVAGHLAPGNGGGADAVAAADTPSTAQVGVAAAVNTSRTSEG